MNAYTSPHPSVRAAQESQARRQIEKVRRLRLEVEKKLMRHVPKEFLLDAHHWLILHGRYVCTARKPRCGACIIEDLCEFKEKTEYD